MPCPYNGKECRGTAARGGFTLMEVLVALGVFLIGFVGVMGLYAGGFRTQENARARITEAMVAEAVMETLREPEAGLKAQFTNVTTLEKIDPVLSEAFPGYWYFYCYEPYGTTAAKLRLLVTVYVFEARFKDMYEADYTTLDAAGRAAYDRNCLCLHSIIEMEAE